MRPQIQPSRVNNLFLESSSQPAQAMPHRWLTATEAAEYLGINPRTILLWARQGRIRAYVLSGMKRHMWRFSLTDLEDFVIHNQVAGNGVICVQQSHVPKGEI